MLTRKTRNGTTTTANKLVKDIYNIESLYNIEAAEIVHAWRSHNLNTTAKL